MLINAIFTSCLMFLLVGILAVIPLYLEDNTTRSIIDKLRNFPKLGRNLSFSLVEGLGIGYIILSLFICFKIQRFVYTDILYSEIKIAQYEDLQNMKQQHGLIDTELKEALKDNVIDNYEYYNLRSVFNKKYKEHEARSLKNSLGVQN